MRWRHLAWLALASCSTFTASSADDAGTASPPVPGADAGSDAPSTSPCDPRDDKIAFCADFDQGQMNVTDGWSKLQTDGTMIAATFGEGRSGRGAHFSMQPGAGVRNVFLLFSLPRPLTTGGDLELSFAFRLDATTDPFFRLGGFFAYSPSIYAGVELVNQGTLLQANPPLTGRAPNMPMVWRTIGVHIGRTSTGIDVTDGVDGNMFSMGPLDAGAQTYAEIRVGIYDVSTMPAATELDIDDVVLRMK